MPPFFYTPNNLFSNLPSFQCTHIVQILDAHRRRHPVFSDLLHHKFGNFLRSFPGRKTFTPGNPGIVALLFFYFLVYFFCYFFFMTASFGVIIDVSRMQAEMNNKNRTIRKIGVVLL